ncbi:MAG: class I tRNA ligase family protein, partial [Deltaproteobacteria bacterium]|nr:class I tRNA ligase family protein [Deltaproteobacteria bacterium]
EDYRSDIVFSQDIIKSLVESYRKIRNTFRFMLGNLHGFAPERDELPRSELTELDRWMLSRFGKYLARIDRAYDEYDFHHVFHHTIELATVDLSAFYFDILKDRLYCEPARGIVRRSAQTVLHILARDMARVLSPVLSFTAEEVWRHLPSWSGKAESVFLAGFAKASDGWADDALTEKWESLRDVRRAVTKVLEGMRKDGIIGNSLDAVVGLKAGGAILALLKSVGEEGLADIFLTSGAKVVKGDGELVVAASKSEEGKCPRCWRFGHGVGSDPTRPELCARCAGVIRGMIAAGEIAEGI